jgi:hypothetical protein
MTTALGTIDVKATTGPVGESQAIAVGNASIASPDAASVTVDGKTAEAIAAQEVADRKDADSVLKAASRAFAKGEKALRAGMLESGLLAHDYVVRRMRLTDARSAAVDVLRLELQRHASGKVNVNTLIQAGWAHKLLAGTSDAILPWGHYRDALSQLVDRVNPGTGDESWVLLPGFEDTCRELFTRAQDNTLSRDATTEQCKGILSRYHTAQATAKAAQAAQAKQAADVARQAAEQERAKMSALAAEQAALAESVASADDTTKPVVQAQLDAVSVALKEQQAASLSATNVEALAVKDASKAVRAADKAADSQTRAVAREVAAIEKSARKANPTPPEGRLPNLLESAKRGTVKDTAEMIASIIAEHSQPDDVLCEVFRMLKSRADISRVGKRACDAGLIILSNVKETVAAA